MTRSMSALRRLCLTGMLLAVSAAASTAAAAGDLEPWGTAAVVRVVDGDTVVLDRPVVIDENRVTEGALQVRLVGIQAPKLALGRSGFAAWPLAELARRTLEELTLGRRLTLSFGGRRLDRHGRLLAHLFDQDGVWIQGRILGRGMARVYGFADNRARLGDMLALEDEARAARRGIWGHSFYAVRDPIGVAADIDTFQLVEGTVLDAARVKGRLYLNFGPDWRTDFTVTLSAKVLKLFRREGIDPLSLKGRRVRVRGWIKDYNGPMIEATHPEQIEVLEP